MVLSPNELHQTLDEARTGSRLAVSRLMELVYQPLRELAGQYIRRQGPGHTLQPTALVHEVFLKLAGRNGLEWSDQAHFIAICARAMRGVLVDHARERQALKRGAGWGRVTLSHALSDSEDPGVDVLELDEVLRKLSQLDERQASIVELRVFGGMSIEEIAEALGVSKRTVDNDWAMARAWLSARLAETE